MIAIPQSATRRIPLKAYLSTDHVSDATGKTIAVTISKNGAAFGNPSAGATNATEIANGWYYVDLSATDTGTAGPLIVRGTASGVDNVETFRFVADAHNAGFDGIPSAVAGATSGLPLSADSSGRVDVLKINGTSQTARDLGASVLLSTGTGTGQLDFTGGVVKANLAQILGTALTETAGLLAAGFKQFFNIDSPTSTMNTITTVTTATNLTNAATAGDLTATMKASVTTAASSSTPSVTVSDKTGFSLSTAGILAIWHQLTSAIVTASTIGKLILDNLDAAVSTRTKPADTQARVTLVDTLTTYTGDTPQTGDAYARLGAPAGASIAADLAEIEAESDDIAAIKAKTDNLPAAPASTTNITGGTITTVSNLTNAPTAGDLTATMKASVTTAASSSTPSVTVSDKTGFSLSTAGILAIWHQLTSAIVTASTIGKLILDNLDAAVSTRTKPADTQARVTLVDTLTTYTGDTPQTGDAYARLGAPAGASIAADLAEIEAESDDIAAIKAKTDNLPAAPASTTNITGGTITTVSNLTNAPTAGDLTATMKASVTTAASSSTPSVTV